MIFRLSSVFRIGAAALLLGAGSSLASAAGDELERAFQAPPMEAKPWVFWYWLSASSSKAGITADLEAMKSAGIGGAHLVAIKGVEKPPLLNPPVPQFSPEWWDQIKFAFSEADRLGVQLALHSSDGYATAGGPWITPELSMQKLVWTETQVEGGHRVEATLPQPTASEGYYRDIRVVAFPAAPDAGGSSFTTVPKVTTSRSGVDAQFLAGKTTQVFTSDEAGWIQYAFDAPFTCRSLTVHTPLTKGIQFNTYQANRFAVEVSDDGRDFRKVAQLESPRHGWQDGDADTTHAIPEVTAKYFRFVFNPAGAEAGAEDLDSAKWKPACKLQGIELSSDPRIEDYEGKSGQVWRVSVTTKPLQLNSKLCVPLAQCLDLSEHLQPDGRLTWDAPAGRWTVVRFGHTSTGAHNDSAGAQIGLECDKFNPAAARLMFDRWFAEIIQRVGPELAGRVLKVFHVDSWECGSQNWSPVFRDEFKRRRGYDPLPYLPIMAGIPIESVDLSERFLHDVRETIGELVTDNFYRPLEELARARGCRFSAECDAPTMVSDGMAHYGVVDVPMGEFWLRSPTHDKPNDILDAISGARAYGKPVVQAEAFTELQLQWDESPSLLKILGDRNYALGINRFVYHVFGHNPWMDRRPGMTLGHVGLYFQRDQTWWHPGRAWVEYAQRCQALLQQGAPVVDLAVFTGEDTPRRAVVPWHLSTTLPGFFPQEDPRRAKRILEGGDWVDPLHGYAYDSLNRDALLRLAKVHDHRIELPGGSSYAALVIPASNVMMPDAGMLTPEVATRLKELAQAGATIILGERPQASPSLSDFPRGDKTVAAAAEALWANGTVVGSLHALGKGRVSPGPFAAGSFEPLGLSPDLNATTIAGERGENVAWTHRRGADWDFYFVSNQTTSARELTLSFRLKGRAPELWDPVTGEMRTAGAWRSVGERTELSVKFPPSGAFFVVFRRPTAEASLAAGKNWADPVVAQTLPENWSVLFDPAFGGPKEAVSFSALKSWTEQSPDGIRHYSGTASYTQSLKWSAASGASKARVWLDLGRVADLAEVTVNGQACGVAWTPPYRVEVTSALKEGENEIRIDVTNTWFNRLAGDHALPEAQRLTWTTAPDRSQGKPLREAGLLGPVTLMKE